MPSLRASADGAVDDKSNVAPVEWTTEPSRLETAQTHAMEAEQTVQNYKAFNEDCFLGGMTDQIYDGMASQDFDKAALACMTESSAERWNELCGTKKYDYNYKGAPGDPERSTDDAYDLSKYPGYDGGPDDGEPLRCGDRVAVCGLTSEAGGCLLVLRGHGGGDGRRLSEHGQWVSLLLPTNATAAVAVDFPAANAEVVKILLYHVGQDAPPALSVVVDGAKLQLKKGKHYFDAAAALVAAS